MLNTHTHTHTNTHTHTHTHTHTIVTNEMKNENSESAPKYVWVKYENWVLIDDSEKFIEFGRWSNFKRQSTTSRVMVTKVYT